MNPFYWPRTFSVIGLALAVAVTCLGCGNKTPDARPATADAPARVTAAKPERKTIHRSFTQPGQIDAFDVARLHAKVPAYVEKYLVDIGDSVKGPRYGENNRIEERGQVLAELSAPELEQELQQKKALVAQAGAEVEQSQAAIKVAELGVVSAEALLTETEAGLDRANAEHQRWNSEYGRVVQLVSKSAVNQKLADETKAQLMAAAATQKEAKAKIESARSGIGASQAQLEKSRADEVAARARSHVAEAEEARVHALTDYLRIEAPFDGTVSQRNADIGNFAQSGGGAGTAPLFVVVRTDRVRVFVDLPETEVALVRAGNRALVRVPSLAGREFEGSVTRTAWALDPAARTLHTEVDVPNPTGELRPGMYAEVSIELAASKNPCIVPITALVTQQNQPWCFVLKDGKAVRQAVTVGVKSKTEVEIASGLNGDELVITKAAGLTDGQAVELDPTPVK